MGAGTGPAVSPDANRVMEQVFVRLCQRVTTRQYQEGGLKRRWARIIHPYQNLQTTIRQNAQLQRQTNIALLDVNQYTLSMWCVKPMEMRETNEPTCIAR